MTQLLVSVRNAAEAVAALAAGADVLDVKEPERGSLGAASCETITEVLAHVAGRAPVSAACGEIFQVNSALNAEALPPGLTYAKYGLAGAMRYNDWPQRWRAQLAALPSAVQSVAVAYADFATCAAPPPRVVLETGAALGCRAFLIDTYEKSRGALFAQLAFQELAALGALAQQADLMFVLAGSLTQETLPQALALAPGVVAVRGAVCVGGREKKLSAERVRQLAQLTKMPANAGVF